MRIIQEEKITGHPTCSPSHTCSILPGWMLTTQLWVSSDSHWRDGRCAVRSCVVRPHSQNVDDLARFENLVNQTVLNVDPSRVTALQFPLQRFVSRWRSIRVFSQNLQKFGGMALQIALRKLLRILLRLPGKDDFVAHQSSFPDPFSIPSFRAFWMDSTIPGIEWRNSVS